MWAMKIEDAILKKAKLKTQTSAENHTAHTESYGVFKLPRHTTWILMGNQIHGFVCPAFEKRVTWIF